MERRILKAELSDMPEILKLQYLAYQSEAKLFGSKDIPPLKQTLDEVTLEYNEGIILKMLDDIGNIIGSVRAKADSETVFIGKLMVHPQHRRQGFGSALLLDIERCFPDKRYELFTSTRSKDNIRLYQKLGYRIFKQEKVDNELEFVFFEKIGGSKMLCQSIEEVRENIDRIDREIIKLIAERKGFVLQAAAFKKSAEGVKAPHRVEEVIRKVREKASEYGADPDMVEALYREMISRFIKMETDEFNNK